MTDFATGHASIDIRRGLVVDAQAQHLRRMRQTIWVYLYVLLAVNRTTGVRLIDPGIAAAQMGIAEATVRSSLGHLRKQGYLRIERDGQLLRVTVTKWRSVGRESTTVPRKRVVALSADALAARLGGNALDPFWKDAVTQLPARVIRDLLDQVERVPAEKIRKSREALFRYLVQQRH